MRTAALAGLDALAVDHRGRGRGFATGSLKVHLKEPVIDLLEQALVGEAAELPEDRASA